jgi:peroxiredoxin Q/BCP
MKRMLFTVCAGISLLWSAVAMAGQAGTTNPVDLKVGDMAPAFSLPGTDGKMHTLADYRGTTVVLAWFPKAFTGG